MRVAVHPAPAKGEAWPNQLLCACCTAHPSGSMRLPTRSPDLPLTFLPLLTPLGGPTFADLDRLSRRHRGFGALAKELSQGIKLWSGAPNRCLYHACLARMLLGATGRWAWGRFTRSNPQSMRDARPISALAHPCAGLPGATGSMPRRPRLPLPSVSAMVFRKCWVA